MAAVVGIGSSCDVNIDVTFAENQPNNSRIVAT